MTVNEPNAIAWLLLISGVLVLTSVLFSRTSERIGLPAVLLFLLLGLAAGSWLPVQFDDHGTAFRLGTVALVLILFDGGLNTPWKVARAHLAPASVLATLGVAGTALLMATAAWLLGLGWIEALLLGAIVSSTDAAAVFSALRGANVQLRRRVSATLELESGLNDPMAVILTIALTGALATPESFSVSQLLLQIVLQLVIGALSGLFIGVAGRWIVTRIRVPVAGLYPAMTVALALLAFALPTLMLGSGFLAVYVAGLVLGNGRLPYRAGIIRVHDALAWLGQITLFLALGLLARPALLPDWFWTGLVLALILALVARPVVVWLCLAPFAYPRRESAFIAWMGLRGAVPILLASYPVMAGVEHGLALFHLVFFIVVVNALVPGATVRWAVERLGVERAGLPRPSPVLEIMSTEQLPVRILSFLIEPAAMVAGIRLDSLPLPQGTRILLVIRDGQIVALETDTTLQAGDHVHLMCSPGQIRSVELLFGLREED
ncbi:MAG: potassium/proton antiporter [Wenzhouxiangellaceae bacterium]